MRRKPNGCIPVMITIPRMVNLLGTGAKLSYPKFKMGATLVLKYATTWLPYQLATTLIRIRTQI